MNRFKLVRNPNVTPGGSPSQMDGDGCLLSPAYTREVFIGKNTLLTGEVLDKLEDWTCRAPSRLITYHDEIKFLFLYGGFFLIVLL